MNHQPEIRIGIRTEGPPVIMKEDDTHIVRNLLIGDGFHWQKSIIAMFKGDFFNLEIPQGNIHCVNVLPIEDYIVSVASSEMNPEAPLEFLKAHSVISRTWALKKIINPVMAVSRNKGTVSWEESDSHIGFDVCGDDHCQRYQGINPINESVKQAVKATFGEILIDSTEKIADTRFSKCCGGKTEVFSTCWADEDYDYLVSKKDPWCDISSLDEVTKRGFIDKVLKSYDKTLSDFGNWEVSVRKNTIANNIRNHFGTDLGQNLKIHIIERGKSGRIKTLGIIGDNASLKIGKELTVRKILSDSCLYSSWFDITDNGDSFMFKGHGWGHGVGLCQIGAVRMAFEGKNYREILEFYYPGLKLKKAYD